MSFALYILVMDGDTWKEYSNFYYSIRKAPMWMLVVKYSQKSLFKWTVIQKEINNYLIFKSLFIHMFFLTCVPSHFQIMRRKSDLFKNTKFTTLRYVNLYEKNYTIHISVNLHKHSPKFNFLLFTVKPPEHLSSSIVA